jgi:hypothetical protein
VETITLKLCRPYDRDPSNHHYAEPFDSTVDAFVGGASAWSIPRNTPSGNPEAVPPGKAVKVVLHEDGPILQFFLENWQQIPNALSAVGTLISAWYAARAFRQKQLPPQDFRGKGGTRITIGDVEVSVDSDLSAEQLAELAGAVAQAKSKWSERKGGGSSTRRRRR